MDIQPLSMPVEKINDRYYKRDTTPKCILLFIFLELRDKYIKVLYIKLKF